MLLRVSLLREFTVHKNKGIKRPTKELNKTPRNSFFVIHHNRYGQTVAFLKRFENNNVTIYLNAIPKT